MSRNSVYVSRRRQNLSPSRSFNRNNNIASFQSSVKLGAVSHTILVSFLVLVLGLIYLTQATQPSIHGYEVQKIDNEISELQIRKNDLEVENARLTAISTIEKTEIAKNLKPPVAINYAE